ncbi:MAG TPA: tRNA pseudouridine(55) synthase TruB [Candidatus Dormibacteraeota bacterium]|nr:tRNA pseudouridine(55) synthase TruB [Candidatus Dormibacteraeota bacterium]
MEGILLVDKPAGWTSFDVVNYVRRMVANAEGKKPKSIKVGHSGTLDPFATGLLILLIGKNYTRRAKEFSDLDKTYEVALRLGVTSSTGDPEGNLTPMSETRPSLKDIHECVAKLTGKISQTPPAYSAIKINGQRAYKLARAGKQVVIEPRNVVVHQLSIKQYAYPEVTLMTDVSSGTYIRSLVETMGQMLHTGAYTTTLRRTQIGEYSVDRAEAVETLDIQKLSNLLQGIAV